MVDATEDVKTETPAGETPSGEVKTTPVTETPAKDEPAKEQTVPLARLQAVIAQKAEETRAKEALTRELKLANDTLEEFRNLGTKTGDQPKAGDRSAPQKALSPDELQRLVAQESERQTFDRRCNESVAEGRKTHQDFDKVVLGDLTSISPVVAQNGRPVLPQQLVEAALETGNAHEVLYALGQDINEASRIMGLRPVAQAMELAKFAAKLAVAAAGDVAADADEAATKVSRAPAPIKSPTKGGSTKPAFRVEDTENFSTEEWIKQREKQIADARANR